jgi:hypothetical protein
MLKKSLMTLESLGKILNCKHLAIEGNLMTPSSLLILGITLLTFEVVLCFEFLDLVVTLPYFSGEMLFPPTYLVRILIPTFGLRIYTTGSDGTRDETCITLN